MINFKIIQNAKLFKDITLCDLAGLERVAKLDVSSKTKAESIHINGSLQALASCLGHSYRSRGVKLQIMQIDNAMQRRCNQAHYAINRTQWYTSISKGES